LLVAQGSLKVPLKNYPNPVTDPVNTAGNLLYCPAALEEARDSVWPVGKSGPNDIRNRVGMRVWSNRNTAHVDF